MILELKNISKTYPSGRRALQSISFKIEEGEILAIIGLSGAGKSTMLRCINRLVEPDEGEVIFLGEKINRLKGKKLRQYRSKIGMIFQNYNLVERLNAVENVLHGCLGSIPSYRGALGLYTEEEKEKAFALLQTVGMEEFAFQRCSELSGGQKQRIGIARALMQSPSLLLCDEPIASLDPQSAETVLNYIKEFAVNKNIACLISLHQMEAAKKYADRIIALNNGKIVFDGKPDSLNDEVLHKEIFANASMDSGEKAL